MTAVWTLKGRRSEVEGQEVTPGSNTSMGSHLALCLGEGLAGGQWLWCLGGGVQRCVVNRSGELAKASTAGLVLEGVW